MRILVTGGSGFIGRHVVEALRRRGEEVSVVDLVAYGGSDVPFVIGDIRERSVVEEALSVGTDAVVHLAAVTSVLQSVNDPEGVFTTNVTGTELFLERARELGVGRFVLASTNAVVGDIGAAVIDEKSPLSPLTPYGATKAAAEMLCSAYRASYGIAAVALRFTNVYGAGMQPKDSVIARIMRAALSLSGIEIYGDGSQLRDYVYVTDVLAAIELALDSELPNVLTIGAGESVSMNELHRLSCEATGVEIPARHVEAKAGEMPAVRVDISHAASYGFVPQYSLARGLLATWADYRERAAATP